MKTDIEIAQSARMLPISQVAARAGIDESLLEHYGRVKAKIDIGPLRDRPRKGSSSWSPPSTPPPPERARPPPAWVSRTPCAGWTRTCSCACGSRLWSRSSA